MGTDIKAVVWDLDNTLYKFSLNYMSACDWASARAFVECGVPLSLQEAYEGSRGSFAKHKMHGLMLIERYKVDPAIYFKKYHDFLDEKSIDDTYDLRAHFEASRKAHAILSHGSKDWAKRALTHIGIKQFFDDSLIVAFEDYDFLTKSLHADGFNLVAGRLGLPTSQILFVEDSHKNLRIAKELGMTTALVTHDTDEVPAVDYIDHRLKTPMDVFSL